MAEKISFQKITLQNLELACQIQNAIFPEEDGRQNFIEQINNDPYRKEQDYYIVYADSNPVGVTGIYSYHEYPIDAWLGWFGILEEYRHHNYGGIALDKTIDLAKQKGYSNFRLYTDEYAKSAHKLYESRGLIKELYDNPDDQDNFIPAKIYIYSRSLTSKPITKWNNKVLGLKEQSNKEHNVQGFIMQYQLSQAKSNDISKIKEYKLATIIYANTNISFEDKEKIINYVNENIPKQISNYQKILINEKTIGCLLVTPYKEGVLLDEIYLEKKYRGHYIGTKIITNICSQNNKVYLWVYKTNKKAINLYQKLNFQIIDETATRFFMLHTKKGKNL